MASDKKDTGAQAAAAGLLCSVRADVLPRGRTSPVADGARGQVQRVRSRIARSSAALSRGEARRTRRNHWEEWYVCMASLPCPVVRTLASPLMRVVGMAWSPAGKRLCVVAGDPSVGMLSMDGRQPQSALSVFSLFLAGKDEPDLAPVTGPITLRGIPRWSPAGDAVAMVGRESGGTQVALVVTTDRREPRRRANASCWEPPRGLWRGCCYAHCPGTRTASISSWWIRLPANPASRVNHGKTSGGSALWATACRSRASRVTLGLSPT